MRILLDHCVDRRIARFLPAGHEITTAREMGWESLKNGELLIAAGREFDVLLTVDRGFSQQQNQAELPVAVVVIMAVNNRLETLVSYLPKIEECLSSIAPRQLIVIREQSSRASRQSQKGTRL